MQELENLLEFDDDDAVKFILDFLPESYLERLDEDTINYVLDVVYEYYDECGIISEDVADEASIDEEEMLKYVLKASKKDGIDITEDDVQAILDGEYEYGKSIGIYSED